MKKIFKKYFFLMILIFSIININIPMPISDNGILQVALIEIIFPIAILVLSILIFTKKIILKDGYEKIFKFIIIFIAFYIFITILRIFLGYEFKQSLLAIKVTIFPMILLFLSKYLRIDKEYIIKNLITFEFFINCVQMCNYTNFRMSNFLGNIMVYLAIIGMLFILNVYVLKENKYSLIMKIFSFFNILISATIPLISGARSAFFILVLISFCAIIYCLIEKKIKYFLTILILFISGFGINIFLFNNCKNHMAIYSERVLPSIFEINNNVTDKPIIDNAPSDDTVTPAIPNDKTNNDNLNIPIDDNTNDENTNIPTVDNINTEKIKSDDIRKYLVNKSIESIKKSPLIGEGIMYFDVSTDYGVSLQSAHNFILEYINAYGIIGFIIYLFIHWTIITNIIKKSKDKNLYILILLTIPTILIQSLVQPTMLIVPIVTIYYSLYSLYLGWSEIYE